MLKEALRRLLWLLPTLLVVTVPIFLALSRAMPDRGGAGSVPLFFDRDPVDLRQRAMKAMAACAAGDVRAGEALARMGGAALPYVLPRLDTLPPEGRGRVALALAPMAKRMGTLTTTELDGPETAVLFWNGYWAQHSIDFRDAVVERAVSRLRERPTPPRRAEVRELDTFAVGELVSALRPLETREDVEHVRALTEALEHATGRPEAIPRGASLETATRIVESWEDFWRENRSAFVTYGGIGRLTAMITETEYGRWASQFLDRGLGRSADGKERAREIRARAPVTLVLVGAGIVGGYALALLAAVYGAARTVHELRALGALTLALLSLSGLGTAVLAGAVLGKSLGTATLVMVWVTAAFAGRHTLALLGRIATEPHWHYARALGIPAWRSLLRSMKACVPSLLAHALSDLPAVLTLAFVVERAFGLVGLADLTVAAAKSRDMTWLMALATVGTLLLGMGQILADLALLRLDPRPMPELRHRMGHR